MVNTPLVVAFDMRGRLAGEGGWRAAIGGAEGAKANRADADGSGFRKRRFRHVVIPSVSANAHGPYRDS
jgi:hypothetical protein